MGWFWEQNECDLSPLCYEATALASDEAREERVLKKRRRKRMWGVGCLFSSVILRRTNGRR